MNLILLHPADRIEDGRVRLSDHRAVHIRNILGVDVGDSLECGWTNGTLCTGTVHSVDSESVELTLHGEKPWSAPSFEIDLICALPRPQTVKKVLQYAAAMAVRRIDFIRANRVERSFFQSQLLEPDNLMAELLEGCAQGKQTRLPELAIHERFRPFVEDLCTSRECTPPLLKLLPHPDSPRALGGVWNPGCSAAVIAVGPEGGWVPFELDLFESVGFRPFRLGGSILRVEAAVVAAVAQTQLLASR